MLEIPVENPEDFGVAIKNSGSNKVYKKEYTKTSFLIMKNAGGYKAFVMTIAADSSYIRGDLSKLVKNKYNKRDSLFSGVVVYYTPQGEYINSWQYTNGKLAKSKISGTNDSVAAAKISSNYKTNTYVEVECTFWYQQVTSPDGVAGPWTYWGATDCEFHVYDTPGSAPVGGGGGAPSSPNPPKDPCLPESGSSHTSNGYKPLGNAPWEPGPSEGGGGNDDGGFPPPTPVPCPTISYVDIDDIDNEAILPLNKLCASSFQFAQIVAPGDGSRGWKEASVANMVISVYPSSYLENIWQSITGGADVAVGSFNIEAGVPGDIGDRIAAEDVAWAINYATVKLEQVRGIEGLKAVIRSGTLGPTVAKLAEKILQTRIPGARLNSQLSGRTTPHTPIVGVACR